MKNPTAPDISDNFPADHRHYHNNFNVLRLAAACLVVVSHCIELSTGLSQRDILHQITGFSLSWVAVSAFFAISGYLVMGSWSRTPEIYHFCQSRVLRIWPGLVVMTFTTVATIGVFFTKLRMFEFFTSPETIRYAAGTISVIGVRYELPGTFLDNPLRIVNGSLWTLRYELICYLAVLFAGSLGVLKASKRFAFLVIISLLCTAYLVAYDAGVTTRGGRETAGYELARLALCFFLGALFQDLGLSQSHRGIVLFILSLTACLALGSSAAVPVLCITISYTTLWIALVPNGAIWIKLRDLPDYSYGIYIYSFAITQCVLAVGIRSTLNVMAVSFSISILLAALSWHLVEKPALRLKIRHSR